MDAAHSDKPSSEETNIEHRIHVESKKQVQNQMNKYKELLKTVFDGQTELTAESKQELLEELLANFEAAVKENVLVNGQPWDDAPDAEEDVDLEGKLDDVIVETSYKRRTYPKKIVPHVVHTLKAERKLLGLYKNTLTAQEITKDPEHESVMNTLSTKAPDLAKQATQILKSIQTLQKQAEGLGQILNSKPSAASLEIHREVFGHDDQSDSLSPPTKHRQPIKRLIEEAAATDCYIPVEQ